MRESVLPKDRARYSRVGDGIEPHTLLFAAGLHTHTHTPQYPEGKAVVAWCEEPCNIGSLGSDAGEASKTYAGMKVKYSGYDGVGGEPGKEYVQITGIMERNVEMKAFAYQAGRAVVHYTYDRTQTGCCLGYKACGGEFAANVMKNQAVDIGEIPRGKKNLDVRLYSAKDVDTQIFDVEDKSGFPAEGKAIIAYCDTAGCNKGALGNNDDGKQEQTVYKGRTYLYSGYSGDGLSLGNEFVRVEGVTNTALMMKAYGYASGSASIKYSYFEDYNGTGHRPPQPSVDWLKALTEKEHRTDVFTPSPADTIVVRRGKPFRVAVIHPTRGFPSTDAVAVNITGCVGDDDAKWAKVAAAGLRCSDGGGDDYPAGKMTVEKTLQGGAVYLSVTLAHDAPVGRYVLRVDATAGDGHMYQQSTALAVLFDAHASKDAVYMSSSKGSRDEYLYGKVGLIWQGLSDDNTGHTWDFNQFEWQSLDVALDLLRRMPVADRGDAALVARHLTYSIGADVCSGKWGDGSYTTGSGPGYRCSSCSKKKTCGGNLKSKCTEPGDWTGTSALLATYKANDKPVQYCQCFVYAGLTTTIGRALGIPTRPVTNFQSAHDGEKNRAIEKYYTLNGEAYEPSDEGPSHDSVWSFHVWNEVFMKRPSLTGGDGWQAIDATPQEFSAGGSGVGSEGVYQMGPASIALIKKNEDPRGGTVGDPKGWDNEFVISETNANIVMWVPDAATGGKTWRRDPAGCEAVDGGAGCGFPTDPWGDPFNTIGLQIRYSGERARERGGYSIYILVCIWREKERKRERERGK